MVIEATLSGRRAVIPEGGFIHQYIQMLYRHDLRLFQHSSRVAELCLQIGEQLRLSENDLRNPNKVYVDVIAIFHADGSIRPLIITWKDGRKYKIDKIIDVRRAASLKAGGVGIRYACIIQGHQTYLFLEKTRWWVERKCL